MVTKLKAIAFFSALSSCRTCTKYSRPSVVLAMCKVLDGRLAFREIWNAREEVCSIQRCTAAGDGDQVMANKGRAEAGKALEAARVAETEVQLKHWSSVGTVVGQKKN